MRSTESKARIQKNACSSVFRFALSACAMCLIFCSCNKFLRSKGLPLYHFFLPHL